MQLGRYVRSGFIHAEELCAFPSLPCSPSLLPRVLSCLHVVYFMGFEAVGLHWTFLSPLLPQEDLKREVKVKTDA